MRRLTGGVVAALTLAFFAAGCDNQVTTPTTPTTPTVTVTEAFSGTITTNGAATFFFSTSGTGFVTATLKSVSPDSTVQLGVGLGTWNGVTCQTIITNDRTSQGISVTGAVSAAGSLCVRMYDANGALTQPTTFEVVVVHP